MYSEQELMKTFREVSRGHTTFKKQYENKLRYLCFEASLNLILGYHLP